MNYKCKIISLNHLDQHHCLKLIMGKEDGVIAIIVIRTMVDKDILVVVDDIAMMGAEIILDHMI